MIRIDRRQPRQTLFTATMLPIIVFGSSILAEAKEASERPAAPEIQVLDPMETEPLVHGGSPDALSGRSQHRRVVSKPNQHSVGLDVGYNIYRKGVGSDNPYAYDKDELCYFPSGTGRFVSDGDAVLTQPGHLMWRPARAATQSGHALTDMVTICAFTPAREDPWSHRLPAAEIGKWDGDPGAKPKVRWFRLEDAKIILRPDEPNYRSGRIVERLFLPAQKDGVKGADVTFISYKAGVQIGPRTNEREQICWLESGDLQMTTTRQTQNVKPGFFLYSPAGSHIKSIDVTEDSDLLCFTVAGSD